jgi:hypothetical protein
MPLDQPTFPGERLITLIGPGRILTSAFATNPAAALDDDPETFASFGEEVVVVTPGEGQALDVVYLIDRSGSMEDEFSEGTRMDAAVAAILAANQTLAVPDNDSRVGIVSFGAGGIAFGNLDTQVEAELTDDFEYLTAVLESLLPVGTSPTREGLLAARALLEARSDTSRAAVLFLLTDGVPDNENGARTAAASLKAAHPDWKLIAIAAHAKDDPTVSADVTTFLTYIGSTVGDGFLSAGNPAALTSALSGKLTAVSAAAIDAAAENDTDTPVPSS